MKRQYMHSYKITNLTVYIKYKNHIQSLYIVSYVLNLDLASNIEYSDTIIVLYLEQDLICISGY